jgi:DNA-binding beta-propeller fold protein YncE
MTEHVERQPRRAAAVVALLVSACALVSIIALSAQSVPDAALSERAAAGASDSSLLELEFEKDMQLVEARERYVGCGRCMRRRCHHNAYCGHFYSDAQTGGYQRGACMCGCCKLQCGLENGCARSSPYASDGLHTDVSTLPLSAGVIQLPAGLALAPDGASLFVADERAGAIWRVDTATGAVELAVGANGTTLNKPRGIAFVPGSDPLAMVVADTANNRIRLVEFKTGTPAVSTLAGTGGFDLVDGAGAVAQFASPVGVAASASFVVVADSQNDVIRSIDLGSRQVTTLAGAYSEVPHDGVVDGVGPAARFSGPTGVLLSADGTVVYVADSGNQAIRQLVLATRAVTTIAGMETHGSKDGLPGAFFNPYGLSLSADGKGLLVTDSKNELLRFVHLDDCNAKGSCRVSTLAGLLFQAGNKDGRGPDARFNNPSFIVAAMRANDSSAAFYISDTGSGAVRVANYSRTDD